MSEPKDTFSRYWRQLTPEQIAAGEHRPFVGGHWDEIGKLQLDFLRDQGLKPFHNLLDVGCGAMRAGVHFVRFLEPGHYFGFDLNASLIDAGRLELKEAGLSDRNAQLLVNGLFESHLFGRKFDFAIAQSVFTHLPINHIIRCLVETRKVLRPDGRFFATFFHAPTPVCLDPVKHDKGGAITRFDSDPFHYGFEEFEWMAKCANLRVELIGEWNHPNDQRMLVFSKEE